MRFIGPVSNLTKIILVAIGFWFLILILLFVFPNMLPTVSGLAGLLSLPVIPVLLILALIALIRDKYKLWPALSVILIPLVFYLVVFHMNYWGALANFYLNKSYYEATAKSMIMARSDDERRSAVKGAV